MDQLGAKLIGDRLRNARKERHLTQAVLAQKVDIAAKYLSNIECGEKLPKLETFIELVNALKVDANSILVDVLDAEEVVNPILCSELSMKVSKLPPDRQKKALKMLEALVDEFSALPGTELLCPAAMTFDSTERLQPMD